MEKIMAIWKLFHQGEEVANPAAWKQGHNMGMIIGGFILTLFNVGKAFGYDIPIDTQTANTVGLGIAAAASFVLNNITSARAGLPPVSVDGSSGGH